jgi:hypothetical protein
MTVTAMYARCPVTNGGCRCAREAGHGYECWCVVCDRSHAFDGHCGAVDGICICSLPDGHNGACHCEIGYAHTFGGHR